MNNKQKNQKIQYQKIESSIKKINESKLLLEEEFFILKDKKEREEKDYLVTRQKKEETKQKLSSLQRVLDEITGGDERTTRYTVLDHGPGDWNRPSYWTERNDKFISESFQCYQT